MYQCAVYIGRERLSARALQPHTLPPLPLVGGSREGEMASSSSTRHPPPPSPSPTWAEVARGGSSRGGESDQTRGSSPPLPPPSAYTQYVAWVHCRREGIPARLVLETDGRTEDICLWFRSTATGGISAADVATHAQYSGKKRQEQGQVKVRLGREVR